MLWVAGIAAALPIINTILTLKFGKNEKDLIILLGTIFIIALAAFVYAIFTIFSLT